MEHVDRPLSLIINVALVALLGASWAASYYPHLSSIITITAVVGAVLISASVPLINRLAGRREPAFNVAGETPVPERPSDTGEAITDVAPADSKVIMWSDLLKAWDDPHKQPAPDDIFHKVLRKALNDSLDGRDFQQNSINIGIVNLVISQNSASIKLKDNSRIHERRTDHKIDVVLRPDLDPNSESA